MQDNNISTKPLYIKKRKDDVYQSINKLLKLLCLPMKSQVNRQYLNVQLVWINSRMLYGTSQHGTFNVVVPNVEYNKCSSTNNLLI